MERNQTITNTASTESALMHKPRSIGAFFYIDADALYAFKGRGFGGEVKLVSGYHLC